LRTFTLTLAAAVLALTAHGAPAPLPKPDPNKDELKKMQGTWDQVSEQEGGRAVPVSPGAQLVVSRDRLKFFVDGRQTVVWRATLDAAKRPRHLDMTRRAKARAVLVRAVYALEGDKLTICYNNNFLTRPTDLHSHTQMVFRRAKKR
jgi:uncharacterized protein (TIGR03067 family)